MSNRPDITAMLSAELERQVLKPKFCMNCGAFFNEYDELKGDAE